MNPTNFKTICQKIDSMVEAIPPTERIAAFDADGTLWRTDLGENFFKFQIENLNLQLPTDPWNYYQDLKKVDAPKAYLWLAQICEGHTLLEVQNWARQALNRLQPFPAFEFQQKVIEHLKSHHFQIYVVTASVKWAVEPGAARLGIDAKNVIGIETQIQNDKVTTHQAGAISYRKGKVDALLAATGNKYPWFCSGNSMGDFELLKSSLKMRVAIQSVKSGDSLFETEQELLKAALENQWDYIEL